VSDSSASRGPATTDTANTAKDVGPAPPSVTAWLPRAVLVASAFLAAVLVASIWLGTDALQSPDAGGDGLIHGMAVALREPLRLFRGWIGVTTLLLTASLMNEAYETARFLERRPRFKRLWVPVVWVVPVANLWLPKILLDGLWAANEGPEADSRSRRRATGTWWPLWLAFSTGGFVLFWHDVAAVFSMYSHPPPAADPVDLWLWLRVLVSLLAVPAYLAWRRVVRGLACAVRVAPFATPADGG
jgi:hypothetical protein